MTSHLDIQINGHSLELPQDFSLPITEENPIFHDVELHSYPVEVPLNGNREVFKNVEDADSVLRPIEMEHQSAKINVSGIPYRTGSVVIQENEELIDQFAFNIDESTQSFRDLISDLKCRDVPLYNNEKIRIGQKISDISITTMTEVEVDIKAWIFHYYDTFSISNSAKFDPNALGFSYPGIAVTGTNSRTYPNGITVAEPSELTSYINVSEPYQSVGGVPAQNAWRYCNARVCYPHHGLNTEKAVDDEKDGNDHIIKSGTIGETTDEIVKNYEHYSQFEDYGPFWVLDAKRPQSGICFYVLYFLDCLFNHLGVAFDNSALTAIEDFKRLAFFTTHCRYMTDETETASTLNSLDEINNWLDGRGCGGRIEVYDPDTKDLQEYTINDGSHRKYVVGEGVPKVEYIKASGRITSVSASAKIRFMYATSENFPDATVAEIIDSLEKSFGIRFRYDYQMRKVTAYLMRDVFRQRDDQGNAVAPIELPCTIISINKLSEKITGVSMKYSSESDTYEQQQNIRQKVRDYETDYDYMDYRQGRTQVGTGYQAIASDLHTENVTCYVDLNTANAYRFKIDKDAETNNIAYHALFEVAQFHGIEVGDCSKQNKDYVKEFVSNFQPVSFNDVNAYAQRQGSTQSLLAAFVDEEMEHEFVTQRINYPIYADIVDINATAVLKLAESYDPTKTDDGNSPLQEYDWGLAIALMRGGGTDAVIQNFDAGYDGFGNSRWRTTAGTYAMASDTMDQFGNTFDYNGTDPGDGGGERFSLKIRAYKPFLYYQKNSKTYITTDLSLEGKAVEGETGKTWLIPSNATKAIARRGLADTFMAEYIDFLLHRKLLRIRCLMEIAQLIDIPNHWNRMFRIGKKIGFIDKLNYEISSATGIGEVTIDFYAI